MAATVEARVLAKQFDDLAQQRDASTLAMWVFIVTEIMLFGGLFAAYTVYRWAYRPAWVEGSRHMALTIGAVNTAVLIVSSLTMALAVQSAQRGERRRLLGCLVATASLGTVFLVLKGVEYHQHIMDGLLPGRSWHFEGRDSRHVQIFFWLYYGMTGLHAVHLTIGIGLVTVLIAMAWRRTFSPLYHTPVEVIGLYWHLIDIIWIFLFPIFYLVA